MGTGKNRTAITKRELSQLYYLSREIEQDRKRLEELEAAAQGITQQITGMPPAGVGSVSSAAETGEEGMRRVLVSLEAAASGKTAEAGRKKSGAFCIWPSGAGISSGQPAHGTRMRRVWRRSL